MTKEMTREEAIKNLKKLKSFHNGSYGTAIDMAIKALEQQLSKDCVSRESVLMELGKYLCGVSFDEKGIDEVIKELPSVTPTRPHGKWIDNHNGTFECDRCGCKHSRSNYCPNCGADMRGEEE